MGEGGRRDVGNGNFLYKGRGRSGCFFLFYKGGRKDFIDGGGGFC